MRVWILWFALVFAVLLEGIATTLPILLNLLLVFYIIERKSWLFGAAFVSGLLLDLFVVGNLGQRSIVFVFFLFIIATYERKFEIETFAFVCIASFLGSAAYLFLFGYNFIFLQAVSASFLSVFLFILVAHKRSTAMLE